jgi:hypothetical protein
MNTKQIRLTTTASTRENTNTTKKYKFSTMWLWFEPTFRCYIQEHDILDSHRCENLKSYMRRIY